MTRRTELEHGVVTALRNLVKAIGSGAFAAPFGIELEAARNALAAWEGSGPAPRARSAPVREGVAPAASLASLATLIKGAERSEVPATTNDDERGNASQMVFGYGGEEEREGEAHGEANGERSEAIAGDPQNLSEDEAISRLYRQYRTVLEAHVGDGLFPHPDRIRAEPGPSVRRKLRRALAEATEEQCSLAIDGAFKDWAARRVRGRSLTDVFSTYRNTSDLASRITYFASIASPVDEGVQSHIDDVRRDIRAHLDLPDNELYAARAAGSEDWLLHNGYHVEFATDVDGKQRFSIAEGPGPSMLPRS